ncbi:TPA: DUF551 domain-containing protein [Raoultella ornithinolytica]|nr:DUF551 domain-containing protein [Raoultella ornithinolytica]
MLCEFYEVSNWPDLVRELVKHIEQLQDSAKRNVKPWEDTFPETLLPVYIDKVKQADEACRAAMLQAGNSPAHSGSRPEKISGYPAQDGNSPAQSPIDHGYRPECECSGCKATARICAELAGWIPVSEQMPDENTEQQVLACFKGGDISTLYYFEGRWDDAYGIVPIRQDVTHWMPLPAAPQEVKGES